MDSHSFLRMMRAKCVCIGVLIFFLYSSIIPSSLYADLDAMLANVQVESGEVQFNRIDPATLEVSASDRAIINFDAFSIGANEVVRFIQPLESSSVLARVVGNSTSEIFGALFSNGEFVLINTNGIHFAETANINVGSLIASTLDIQNAVYQAGQYVFEKGEGSAFGQIFNEANIGVTDGGHIAMLGESIRNTGTLTANLGSVVLGLGEKQTLSFDENGLINLVIDRGLVDVLEGQQKMILNEGVINASGGKVVMTVQMLNDTFDTLINNTGVIQANEAVMGEDGVIEFRANGSIENNGTIETDTGKVTIAASGDVESFGTLRAARLEESGAAFRVGGEYHVGSSSIDNLDNAITLSTGNYSGTTSDSVNIIVDDNAVITLTGHTIFNADNDNNGSGAFTMNAGSSINGGGAHYNLTLQTGQNSTLRTITNVGTLTLNSSTGAPVYTTNSAITLFADFSTEANVDLVLGGNLTAYNNLTLSAGTDVSLAADALIYADIDDTDAGLLTISNTSTITGNGYDLTLGSASHFTVYGLDNTIKNLSFGNMSAPSTITMQCDIDITGDLALSHFSDMLTTFNILVDGDIDFASNIAGHVPSITFSGINKTLAARDLNISGGAFIALQGTDVSLTGTFSNDGTLYVQGDETFTGFTNDTNTGTVSYTGSGTYSELAAGDNYYNLTFSSVGGGTYTLDAALDVNGDLNIGHASKTIDVSASNYQVNVAGSFLNTGTFNARNGTVVLEGGGTFNPGSSSFYNLTKSGGGTIGVGTNNLTVTNNLTISAGTLHLSGRNLTTTGATFSNDGTLRLRGSETLTGFTNDTNSGTVYYDAMGLGQPVYTSLAAGNNYNNLTFEGYAGYVQVGCCYSLPAIWQAAGDVDVNGALTIVSGAFDLNGHNLDITGGSFSNDGFFKLEGGETLTGFTNDANSGTVWHDGSGSYAGLTTGDNYNHLLLWGAGTWTLDANLDVDGDLSLYDATLDASVDDHQINIAGHWRSSAGTFNAQNGTVVLDGGNQTISGSMTFYNLSKTETTNNSTDTTLTLSGTTTVNGLLTLDGLDNDDRINLTTGALNANGTFAVDYVDVLASDASGGLKIVHTNTITNGDQFVFNWFAQMYKWIGGASGAETDFNTGANWDLGSAPGAGDEVWIPDTAYDPILDADADVYGLRISAGAVLDLAGFNLEGTGPNMVFLNQGTLRLQGGETVTGLAYDVRYGTVQYQGGSGIYTGLALDNYYNLTFNDADSTWVLDAALNVDGNLTISAGTLDVDNAGNYQINVAGNWNATGGTFQARNGTVVFDGSSTATDGGNNWYDLSVAGSLSFADATTIANDLVISGGTLSGTADITVNGGDVTGNGTINLTGGTFLLDGTGNLGEDSGGWTFYNLMFGNGVGADTTTKSNSVPITVSNNFTIAANQTLDAGDDVWTVGGDFANNGTFTASTSTFNFLSSGTQTLNSGNDAFYNVALSGSGTLQLVSNPLTVVADFTNYNAGGQGHGIFDLNGQDWVMTGATFSNEGTVLLQGDETITGLTMDTDSGTFNYDGSGNYTGLIAGNAYFNLTFSGNGSWLLDSALDLNGSMSITDGVLDVDADDNHQINVGGGWSNAASTFQARAGKVVFDGTGTIGANDGFNDLEINGTTITLGGALDVNGDLIFTSGVLDVSNSNYTIYAGGDWMDNSGSDNFTEGSGTVVFDGTGTITTSGDSFNHIEINTAGTVSLGSAIDVNGNLTVTAGTFDVSASDYQINLAGNWNDAGAGTFTERGGTVVFDGSSQTISSNEAFENITINSTGNVYLGANLDMDGSLTLTSGNLDVDVNNNFQITIGGSWTDTGGATFTPRVGTVVFDGDGTIDANDSFYNVTIDTAGTTTVGGLMDVNGTVTLTTGILSVGTQLNVGGGWTDTGAGVTAGVGLIVFDGAEVINSNSGFGQIEITSGASVTLGQDLSTGSIKFSSGGILNPGYTSCGGGCTEYYQIIAGAWDDVDGSSNNFVQGLGTVIFNGGGGNINSEEAFANVQFTGGTMTLQQNLDIDGTVSFTDGVLASNGFQVNVGSDWTDTGDGGYSGNNLVVFDGTGLINSNSAFYDIRIDGNVTLGGNLDVNHDVNLVSNNLSVGASDYQINVGGNWTWVGGTFSAGAGLVVFDGTGTINTPNAFNDVEINTSGTVTLGATLDIGDDLTITAGTLDASGSNYTLNVFGDWTDTGAGGYTGSGTVGFGGTGTVISNTPFYNVEISSSGTVTLGGAIDVNNNLTLAAGTFDVSADNYQVNVGGSWTDSGAGTFTERSGTVVFDGTGTITSNEAFNDIEINASGTITLGASLDVDDDLTITAGTLNVTPSNYQINVGGDWTDTGAGSFTKESGKVVFDGTGTINSNESFYDVEINTAGVVTMGANLDITAGLSIPAGVLSMNGYWITTTTNFTSGGTLRLQGSESISWTVNDTAAGTFEYVGDNDGNVDVITIRDFGANDYYHLKLNATDGLDVFQLADDSDISGDVTIAAGVFSLDGNDVTTTTTLSNDAVLRLNGPENVSWTVNDTNSGTWEYVGFGPIKYFTGADYYNLHINSNGTNFELTEALDVNGTLTLSDGTLDVGAGNHQINVGGSWVDTGAGTFVEGGGTVVFDGTGTINSNEAFNDVTIAGTMTLGAALDVNDDLTITSGSLDVSGSNYQINVGGDWTDTGAGTFTERSGLVVFDGNGTINANEEFNRVEVAGTISLSANIDINGHFTLTSGSFDQSTYAMNAARNFSIANGATFTKSSNGSALTFDGAGLLTDSNGSLQDLGNVVISGDGLELMSAVKMTNLTISSANAYFSLEGNDFSFSSAAAVSNIGVFRLKGTETLTNVNNLDLDSGRVDYVLPSGAIAIKDFGAVDYYNLQITNDDFSTTLEADLNVDGFLNIDSLTDFDQSTYAMNVAGNFSIYNGATFTKSSNASALTFDGNGTLQDNNATKQDLGVVVIGGTTTTRTLGAATKMTGLTINSGNTLSLAGNNFEFSSAAAVSNEGTFKLRGSETLTNVNNLDINSGTVEYTGAVGSVSVKDFGVSDYYNLIINNSSQTSSLTDALSVAGALTVSAGTFDTALSTVSVSGLGTVSGGTYKGSVSTGNTFNGGLTISGGTYDGNSDSVDVNGDFTLSSGVFEAPSIMFVSGNFNRSGGTFTHNSGSVTLDGGNQTISGSTTFYDLYKQNTSNDSTNETLTFTSGTTTTIDGSLNLDGLDANDMLLIRATGASAATINFTGASTFSGDYLDVEYNTISDNSSGINTPLAPGNSLNTGNTSGWFGTGLDVSGYLYSDEGGLVLSSKTVAISINGAAPAATADSNGSGLYSFTNLAISAGDVLTLYLDGETEKGVLVTLSGGVNMTNMNLYADRLIVRNDNGGSITNANLATADNNGDTDISTIYSLSGSNLSMASGKELFVWSGHTYAPGGDVTTDYLDIRGTYTHGSEAVTINTAYQQSGTFSAGSGAIDINGTFTQTAGTFNQGTSTLNVSGSMALSNGATFTKSSNSSALTFDGTGSLTDSNGTKQDLGAVIISGNSTRTLGAASKMTALTINSGSTLSLDGNNFDFSGASAVSNSGTFRLRGSETLTSVSNLDLDSGTVQYTGDGDSAADTYTIKDFGGTDYYTLSIASTDSADIFQSGAGKNVAGSLTVSNGTLNTNTNTITVTGLTTVSGGEYQASSSAQTLNGGITISGGTFTGAGGDVYVNGNLTLSSGTLTAPSGSFTVEGNWDKTGGNFNPGTGIVTFDKDNGTQTVNSGGSSFYSITHNGFNGILQIVASDLDLDGTLRNQLGEIEQGTRAITIGGSLSLENGTVFTKASNGATITFDGTGSIGDISGFATDLGNIVIGGSGSYTMSDITMTSLTINSGGILNFFGNDLSFVSPGTAVDNQGTIRLMGTENLTNVLNLGITAGLVEYIGELDTAGTYNIKDFGATDYFALSIKSGENDDIFQLNSAIKVADDFSISNTTVFNQSTHALNVAGDFSIANGATFTKSSNSSALTFDGTGNLSDANGTLQDLGAVTIGGTTTTRTQQSAVKLSSLQINSGNTYYTNGYNLTRNTSGAILNDGTFRFQGPETFTNITDFDTNSGTVEFVGDGDGSAESFSFSPTTIYNLLINDTNSTKDTLTTNGGTTATVSGALTVTSGTLSVPHSISITGLVTVNGGTFLTGGGTTSTFNGGISATSGTLTFRHSAQINSDLNINGATVNYSTATTSNMTGNFTMDSGSFTGTGQTLNMGGNWTINGGTFTANGLPLVFNKSSGTQTIKSNGSTFASVTHSGAGTLQLTDTLTVTGFTNSGGIFDLNGQNFSRSSSGAVSNTATIQLRGSETLTNITNLDIDSGTVRYVGDGDSAADTYTIKDFGASDYYGLVINGTDASDIFQLGSTLDVNDDLTINSGSLDVSLLYYQINVGGDWTDTGAGTFAERSGTVVFDGTGTINANEAFNDLTIAGTITLGAALDVNDDLTISSGSLNVSASNYQINVGGDWTDTGAGTFTEGTGTVVFDGMGTINANEAFNDVTIAGTMTLGAALDVNDDITISSGSLYVGASNFQINVGGDWTDTGSGSFSEGTGTVVFDGTGTINANEAFNDLTISNSATITLGAALDINDDFTLSSGSLDVSASNYQINIGGDWTDIGGGLGIFTARAGTVVFDGAGALTSHVAFNDLTIAGTITLSATLDVNDDLTISSGSLGVGVGNYQINVGGDWTDTGSGSFTEGTGTVVFDGTGTINANEAFNDLTIAGTITLGAALDVNDDITISSGSLDVSAFNYQINVGGDWTDTGAGTFNERAGLVYLDGGNGTINANEAFNDIQISVGTKTLGGNLDVNDDLILTSGTLDVSASNYQINIGGDWSHSTATFTSQGGTVVFDGSGLISGTAAFNSVTIAGTATASMAMDVNDDLTILSGTFNSNNNQITVGGDWTDTGAGTFTEGTGTVVFDGTGTINANEAFNDLTIAGTITLGAALDVNDDLTISSGSLNVSASNYQINVGGDWTDTGAGTFTEGTGTVVFDGTGTINANEAFYRVTIAGNSTLGAALDLIDSLTLSSGDLDVSASNYQITIGNDWIDTGAGTFTERGGTVVFSGPTSIDSNEAFNNVTFSGYTVLVSSLDVNGALSIGSGYTLDLDGQNLDLTGGSFSNDGTLRMQGGETLTSLTNDTDSGTIEYDGTGSYLTSLIAGNNYFNLTFSGNGGTWEPNGTVDVNGALTIATGATFDLDGQNLDLTGGSFSNDGTLRMQGGETVTGFTNDTNSGTIQYDGTGSYLSALGGGNSYYNLTFSGNGGTWEPNGAVDINGALTISAGATFDVDGQNLDLTGGTFSNDGTLRMNGNETLTNFTNDTNSGTIQYDGTGSYTTSLIAGNNYYNLTFSGNGGVWEPNGAVDVNGALTVSTGATFDIDGQNLDLTGGSFSNDGTLRMQGGETLTAFTNDINSGTVQYDGGGSYASLIAGNNYYGLNITGSGSFTAAAATDINGNFNQSAGTFVAPAANLTIAGNFTRTGGAFTHNAGAVIFDGTTDQVITTGAATFNDFTVNNTGAAGSDDITFVGNLNVDGTFTLSDGNFHAPSQLFVADDFTYTGGTFTHNSGTVTLDGLNDQAVTADGAVFNDFTVSNTGAAGNDDITFTGDLDVDGNFLLTDGNFQAPAMMYTALNFTQTGGTFTHNNGRVTFDTTATSILDVGTSIDFYDLYVAATSGKIMQFTGGQTFNVLAANTLNVGSNTTLTSTNGTQWNLSVNNAVTAGVAWGSNVTLANVNNVSVNPISAVGVNNGGGNTGAWTFTSDSGNAAINSVLFFDNVVINQEIGIVNETESSTGETQQNDSQNTNVAADEPGAQKSEQSGGGGNTGGNTGGNLPEGGNDNNGGGGFWDFGGGNQKGERKPEKVSYVFVHEGAVDVNSTMVFPGESIGFGADGKAHHRTRAVYVVSAAGVQVLRRNTRTEHKNLKDYQFAEQPAGIAAGKNNSQVYLVLPKSGKVAVMDNEQMRVSRNVYGLEQGSREIAISPDDKQAYVINSMTDTVNVVNLKDNTVVKTIAVGNMPSKVVVSPDGKYVFVTNRLDGTVSKIDPATGETVTTFAAGSSPYGIAMSEDGGKIYVTDTENNVVLMFEESADKKSYALTKKIEVGKAPHAITYDPIGKKIFVANRNSESVTMIDATTQEVLADITVGKRPADIEVTPEGDTAYVANELSGSVSYVDLAQKKVLEDIPTGDAPRELTLSNPPKPSRKSPSKIPASSL